MTRLIRPLAVLALVLGLSAPSWSQESKKTANPNDAGFDNGVVEEVVDEGTPVYGYLAFGFLGGIALFAVARSSRRS